MKRVITWHNRSHTCIPRSGRPRSAKPLLDAQAPQLCMCMRMSTPNPIGRRVHSTASYHSHKKKERPRPKGQWCWPWPETPTSKEPPRNPHGYVRQGGVPQPVWYSVSSSGMVIRPQSMTGPEMHRRARGVFRCMTQDHSMWPHAAPQHTHNSYCFHTYTHKAVSVRA